MLSTKVKKRHIKKLAIVVLYFTVKMADQGQNKIKQTADKKQKQNDGSAPNS